MAIFDCDICIKSVLSESDPYVLVPMSSGYKLVCSTCAGLDMGTLIKKLRGAYDKENEERTRNDLGEGQRLSVSSPCNDGEEVGT